MACSPQSGIRSTARGSRTAKLGSRVIWLCVAVGFSTARGQHSSSMFTCVIVRHKVLHSEGNIVNEDHNERLGYIDIYWDVLASRGPVMFNISQRLLKIPRSGRARTQAAFAKMEARELRAIVCFGTRANG